MTQGGHALANVLRLAGHTILGVAPMFPKYQAVLLMLGNGLLALANVLQ